MNSLLWMLEEPPADSGVLTNAEIGELWDKVVPLISTVVWVIVAILGIVLVIKGITTALAVVKAADEPQVRQEKIASFKYMAIGLGIALVIATIMGTVLTIFKGKLSNAGTDPTGFLF